MIERLRQTPRAVAGAHAAYLVATGIWPLLHRRSFERVTGRKREFWLVRVVGGLAALTGATLGVAVARGKQTPEVRTLAVGSTIVFGLADLDAARRQSRVYLADTVVQALFAPAWIVGWGGEDGVPRRARFRRPQLRALPSRLDDALIERRVRGSGLVPEDVEVEVRRGFVTLRGEVEDEQMAADLVERIAVARGVRGVDPHLAVGAYPRSQERSVARGSCSGVRIGSISLRRCSNAGGRTSDSPRCSGSSSVAKPGPRVAISKSTPLGSRK